MLVLVHICDHHNIDKGYAWPSIDRIAKDIGFKRRATISAIGALAAANLITKDKGHGRGRTTRYRLPWLKTHILKPDSDQPIPRNTDGFLEWKLEKVHGKVRENSARERQKKCIRASENVRGGAPNNYKTINTADPPCAHSDAAGRSKVSRPPTAAEVFDERHKARPTGAKP